MKDIYCLFLACPMCCMISILLNQFSDPLQFFTLKSVYLHCHSNLPHSYNFKISHLHHSPQMIRWNQNKKECKNSPISAGGLHYMCFNNNFSNKHNFLHFLSISHDWFNFHQHGPLVDCTFSCWYCIIMDWSVWAQIWQWLLFLFYFLLSIVNEIWVSISLWPDDQSDVSFWFI